MITTQPTAQHFRAVKDGSIYVYGNGVLYCERPFFKGQLFFINLPFAASYSFSGDGFEIMKQTGLIISDINISLPEPERNKQFGILKVTVDSLSNSPARIYTDKKIIVLNPKFFNYSAEVKIFILLHELGHYYYATEWKCDQYAAHHFLKMGCNPSQAFESLAGVLHTEDANGNAIKQNNDRINRIYSLLTIKKNGR